MTHTPMEELECFKWYVEVADVAWRLVETLKPFERDTLGKQLVRAADSIGANLVGGDGRYTHADALHFFIIARASARETRYWFIRAKERNLISDAEATPLIDRLADATRLLNNLIRYRRANKNQTLVKEEIAEYEM